MNGLGFFVLQCGITTQPVHFEFHRCPKTNEMFPWFLLDACAEGLQLLLLAELEAPAQGVLAAA
jgi:hypothetical protein